jgi:hypothetical protein
MRAASTARSFAASHCKGIALKERDSLPSVYMMSTGIESIALSGSGNL